MKKTEVLAEDSLLRGPDKQLGLRPSARLSGSHYLPRPTVPQAARFPAPRDGTEHGFIRPDRPFGKPYETRLEPAPAQIAAGRGLGGRHEGSWGSDAMCPSWLVCSRPL